MKTPKVTQGRKESAKRTVLANSELSRVSGGSPLASVQNQLSATVSGLGGQLRRAGRASGESLTSMASKAADLGNYGSAFKKVEKVGAPLRGRGTAFGRGGSV